MRSPQQSPHSDTAPKGPTNPRTSAWEPGTATCHTKSHVVPARTARLTRSDRAPRLHEQSGMTLLVDFEHH
jgi:hypothetical protein